MRPTVFICASLLAGCASSGIIPTGQNSYMVTAKSAGGVLTSGNEILGNLYGEANAFCKGRGEVVETINTSAQNAIPFARMPNAKLDFRCVKAATPPAPAASST